MRTQFENYLMRAGWLGCSLLASLTTAMAAESAGGVGATAPGPAIAPAAPGAATATPGGKSAGAGAAGSSGGPRTFAPVNPDALNAAANDMALSPSEIFTPVIEEGEMLEFTISVSPTGMIAGNNILRIPKIRPLAGDPKAMVYEISSTIRSSRLFDMIYKVKIDVSSLMDVKEGYSQFYSFTGLEGSSQRNERIEMDYSGEQAKSYYYSAEDTSTAHRESRRTVALPGRVQDPLCALYALRGAKMEVGRDILMTVTTEERNFPLLIKVLKIEEIDVADLGKRKCYRMEPVMRFGGLFTRKGKLWFWVDQETQLPVRLEVEIPVGKAFGLLTRYEKSPLNKVKERAAAGVKPAEPATVAPAPGPAAPVVPVAPGP